MDALTGLMFSIFFFGIMLGCGVGYAVCLAIDTNKQLKELDKVDETTKIE